MIFFCGFHDILSDVCSWPHEIYYLAKTHWFNYRKMKKEICIRINRLQSQTLKLFCLLQYRQEWYNMKNSLCLRKVWIISLRHKNNGNSYIKSQIKIFHFRVFSFSFPGKCGKLWSGNGKPRKSQSKIHNIQFTFSNGNPNLKICQGKPKIRNPKIHNTFHRKILFYFTFCLSSFFSQFSENKCPF